ncbi:amidohydrolase family protein [Nocardia sp. CA-151230]|uniref:amidohydrolase family protein n=1 Tax=Nocardia sp. CA-151230 TaxID=3239982 RepID=UPI003D8D9DE8
MSSADRICTGGPIVTVDANHPNPNVAAAVTRKSRTGRVLAPEERISVEDALAAQTVNPARHLFAENIAGSITPGKCADLVVLERDPRATAPDGWPAIGVHVTHLAGNPTNQA